MSSSLFEHLRSEALPGCRQDLAHLPSRVEVSESVNDLMAVLFPGYFHYAPVGRTLAPAEIQGPIEETITKLRAECSKALLCCPEGASRPDLDVLMCEFESRLCQARTQMVGDLQAAYEGDPAAKSHEEILLSYPGFWATAVYRIAHILEGLKVPLLPRMMTEYAHQKTGIDIHPGAKIDTHFFIDHGTGVVIGETAVIGKNVKVYQGVTLGALSIPVGDLKELKRRPQQRHPTLEDGVVVYAGATILGGQTVIGKGSVVGGNTWVTQSVPPGSRVMSSPTGQKIEAIKNRT